MPVRSNNLDSTRVPQSLRKAVMQEVHAGALEGHLDEEKTLNKIKEKFYQPVMHQVI